jgi:hypothetical protein
MQQQASPKRRWWRTRNVVCVGVLLVIAGVVYCCRDRFFLSADLRRMQGEWNGEVLDSKGIESRISALFRGHEVFLPKEDPDSAWMEAADGQFRLFDREDRTFFGITVSIPPWLYRGSGVASGTYEFVGSELIFHVGGEGDLHLRRE